MDSFCREVIGQLYKKEGAKVTDWYKMGRGLARPTHSVVKMNAHENHQQKSRIVKIVFFDALLDACQMAILPTKPRLNGYTLICGWLAGSAGYFAGWLADSTGYFEKLLAGWLADSADRWLAD